MEIHTLYEILDLNLKGDHLDFARSNTQSFVKKSFQDEELEDLNLKGVLQHFSTLKSDIRSMFSLKLTREPVTVFFFHEPDLVASLCETKEVMIKRNIGETLDFFISILNQNIENMIDEDTDEDIGTPEVFYEKKVVDGQTHFFINSKQLTTALVEEDLMKNVDEFASYLIEQLKSGEFPNAGIWGIDFDPHYGECCFWEYASLKHIDEITSVNIFYKKQIFIEDIKNLSREEIVEFIKKDLKHIKVEDLDLPWIELK